MTHVLVNAVVNVVVTLDNVQTLVVLTVLVQVSAVVNVAVIQDNAVTVVIQILHV